MKKAILFVNLRKKNAKENACEIQAELEKRGLSVTVFSYAENHGGPPEGEWDIAFSLGGDGTVLFAARSLAASGTPIIPVNLGTLGFIASVSAGGSKTDGWLSVFERWEGGKADHSPRCMISVSVERGARSVLQDVCLNDAVVSASGIAKLIRLNVHASLASGGCAELGFYRCDGFIVATPTGSTAYSLAAGGPILDPEMEAVILNPICPFTLSSRPVVLPAKLELAITVAEDQRSGVLLTVDGQNAYPLEGGDIIRIKQAPYFARLIPADRGAYYAALRGKLSWAGAPASGEAAGGGPHA